MSNEQTAHLLPDEREMLERANAATPGPWKTGPINYADIYGDGDLVALCVKDRDETVADAQFIAASRTDVLELLRRLSETRATTKLFKYALDILAASGTDYEKLIASATIEANQMP